MILINPSTGKEVDASPEAVDLLLAAGFKEPGDIPPPKTGRRRATKRQ